MSQKFLKIWKICKKKFKKNKTCHWCIFSETTVILLSVDSVFCCVEAEYPEVNLLWYLLKLKKEIIHQSFSASSLVALLDVVL